MFSTQKQSLSTEQFLFKQNTQLKSRISQFQELLSLNKSALRASIDYSSQRTPLKQLVNTLYQENSKLKQSLERSHQEWTQTNTKLLISHQLVKVGEINQKDLIDQLKGRILGLKGQLKEKEKRVAELERGSTQFDAENSLHLKLVEISAPNILTVKFHEEIQQLREALAVKSQQLAKEKDRCADLLKMNMLLTKQLSEGRFESVLSSTNKHKRKVSEMSEMLEYHERIMNVNEDSYDELSDQQEQFEKTTKPSPVPKLELSKAKQIQEIIVKKINVEERKKSKNQDLIKGEQMVTIKKILHKELIKNMTLERKVTSLNRFVGELEERNRMLLEARGSYQQQQVTVIGSILNLDTTGDDMNIARQEIIELGREVYQNPNLDKVIYGEAVPALARDWSKSVMFDFEYMVEY